MENDDEFFKQLRNALTTKTGGLDDYAILRYILAALHERKGLEDLTQKNAYELLAKELRLYPQTGENPEACLRAYADRFSKTKACVSIS